MLPDSLVEMTAILSESNLALNSLNILELTSLSYLLQHLSPIPPSHSISFKILNSSLPFLFHCLHASVKEEWFWTIKKKKQSDLLMTIFFTTSI